MGASCSHTNFDIINQDKVVLIDECWKIKTGDGKCNNCNKNIRIEQKTCIDHNIKQSWNVVDILICSHKFCKLKTIGNTVRSECSICKISVPMKFQKNTNEWVTDKIQMKNEILINRKNRKI